MGNLADQQPRANEQQLGEPELTHHEHSAKSVARRRGRFAASIPERLLKIQTRGAQRRDQPEKKRADDREPEGERHDRAIERRGLKARNARGTRHEKTHAGPGHDQAKDAADHAEDKAFHEKLLHEPAA